MKLSILHEDTDVVVVNKPPGIIGFPEGSTQGETIIDVLVEENPALKDAGEAPRYGVVHRLDKDTSGILVVAKSTEALRFLQEQFTQRTVTKKYIALVHGFVQEDHGIIDNPLGRIPHQKKQKSYLPHEPEAKRPDVREARTEYSVTKRFQDYTLLEVVPKTGRKHQIRCHLAHIGHPVVGDKLYGFKGHAAPAGLNRQFLHAAELTITLPGGDKKAFAAPLPEDLQKVLDAL